MARPSKPFWCKSSRAWRCRVDGETQYNRDLRPDDREGAIRWLGDLLQKARERRLAGTDHTVEQLVGLYLRWLKANREPRTLEGYRDILPAFLAEPGARGKIVADTPARLIDAGHLERLRDRWVSEGYSPHYIARLVRSVKACWGWACARIGDREPILKENRLKEVSAPSIPKSPERVVEGDWDVRFLAWMRRRQACLSGKGYKLMARFDELTARLIEFVRATGCRPGEACALTWGQIDWEKGIAVQEKHKTAGKTGRARVIVIPPDQLAVLRELEAWEGRHPEFVFTHKRGRGAVDKGEGLTEGVPWNSKALSKRILTLRKRARDAGVDVPLEGNKRFVMYLFRHDYATQGIRAQVPTADVAAVMGTSARMIEQVYGHHTHDHLKEITARIRPPAPGESGGAASANPPAGDQPPQAGPRPGVPPA